MSNIPPDLRYTKDHEWIRLDNDGTATIGITDYAQESLGDVTFVELPDSAATYDQGEAFGVVESVKAASDLYMPVAGEVLEVNDALQDTPEILNEDPYLKGWIAKIKVSEPAQVEDLLSAQAYEDLV